MDISLLEETTLSSEEFAVLMEIIDKSELDLSKLAVEVQEAIAWCLIHAFGFGRIEERIELRNELRKEIRKANKALKNEN